MATILMTWELGGGFGHMAPMRGLGEALIARGHKVFAVLRDLALADQVFAGVGVQCLQAPFKQKTGPDAIMPMRSFAHILHNTGFGNVRELAALGEAWSGLFELIKPDLVLFDHSPTALLASRRFSVNRVLMGTGFFHPPAVSPLPDLRPWLAPNGAQLLVDEDHVLANANEMLRRWSCPPMNRLADLYESIVDSLITSIPELDCYPDRRNVHYVGVVSSHGEQAPSWPSQHGRRIFAYLKPFPAIDALFKILSDRGWPTIVYGPSLPSTLKNKWRSPYIHYEDHPLDMKRIGAECELAILNGTNAVTVQMLLAGKPTLQIPLLLEQVYNAQAVTRLGAGLAASAVDPREILDRFNRVVSEPTYRARAQQFARDRGEEINAGDLLVQRVEQALLAGNWVDVRR